MPQGKQEGPTAGARHETHQRKEIPPQRTPSTRLYTLISQANAHQLPSNYCTLAFTRHARLRTTTTTRRATRVHKHKHTTTEPTWAGIRLSSEPQTKEHKESPIGEIGSEINLDIGEEDGSYWG